MTLTYAEICAGFGGLGLAVEEAFGAKLAWYSEFDAAPSKIMAHHWPDVPNHGDMTAINWGTVEHVDILSGGTPCQDLSQAGRRAGMTEGTRSNLWVHMREAIAVIKPKYVVWENVRGAYSAKADSSVEQCQGCVGDTGDGRTFLRALGRVLGDLSDLGYDCQWRGVRAADVGACHGRFRVFVLATYRDSPGRIEQRGTVTVRPEHATAEHESDDATHTISEFRRERRLPAPGEATCGESSALDSRCCGACADANPDGGDDDGRLSDEKRCALNGTPTARCGEVSRADIFNGRWCACEATADTVRGGSGRRASESEQEGLDSPSLGSDQGGTNWGEYEPAIRRHETRFGRAAPRPTEPTGRNGGHRLSPRFTEWMMGLPDGWVTAPEIGISRNEQLKACGNGVVPQQATAALQDMLTATQEGG